jgi:FAD/FMN-containing dehydrogenase
MESAQRMSGAGEVVAGRLLEALGRALPGDRIVADPDVLAAMSHDDAEWAPAGRAAAGVRARSESEVQQVVQICAELGAAVVPRGAGTGLSGGANAVDGCVVLDLARMDRVVEIDRDNLLCVVQPGAVNNDVKAAVAEHGLWYPPDPASALVDDRRQRGHQRGRPVLPEVRRDSRLRAGPARGGGRARGGKFRGGKSRGWQSPG